MGLVSPRVGKSPLRRSGFKGVEVAECGCRKEGAGGRAASLGLVLKAVEVVSEEVE